MRVDIHNHTPLCKHASGEPREYIQRAKELGIGVYGFSCHAPMRFDEEWRMGLEELPSYLMMIEELKHKEREEIDIICGLEVDYIHGRTDLLESSVIYADVDYLIGSVHFLGDWGFDNPAFISEYARRDMKQCWKEYLHAVRAMVESELFDIVGHIDLLKIFGHVMPSALDTEVEGLLNAIALSHMSIEINAAGLRKHIAEPYPSREILARAFHHHIPITFASDAHSVEQVGLGYDVCQTLALEVGYTECVIYHKRQAEFVKILDAL